MKAQKYYFLLLLAGLVWVSCEKKVAVPPAAATATNTTAAKDTPTMQVNYAGSHYYTPGATYRQHILFVAGEYLAGPIATDPLMFDVAIYFYAKTTGTYILSTKNYGHIGSGWYYEQDREVFQTDSAHTGVVNLTTLDTIQHIASGTFHFTGVEVVNTLSGVDSCSGTFTNVTW